MSATTSGDSSAIEASSASAKARSAVTNGSKFLPDIDGRSTWARRARDIIAQLIEDRGGEDLTSEAERLILRKAAVIAVQTEQLETKFAGLNADGKTVASDDLDLYQRLANSMRRLLESVGLERVARDVTPDLRDYLEATKEQSDGRS